MYGLTKKEKLQFVLENVQKLQITAYDISKNTTLTEAGVSRILNGTSKNPQENSLNAIIIYLESKVVGTNLNENFTQSQFEEPKSNYGEDLRDLVNCQKEMVKLMKEVSKLKILLEKNNIAYEE
jgi:transcriptional regulator with GAF, ATPase, and Fis domain